LGKKVIELHGVKYYSPEEISKNFPVTLEFILKKIEHDELESCLINGKPYVCEEDMLTFFTKTK
jgi:hypothetical protein